MPVTINSQSGWLDGVARVSSPNHDERPAECLPSLIVIHGISLPPGEFGGPWIDRLFTNAINGDEHAYFSQICRLRVSSHLLIRRDGGVTQYVPFTHRAWHAGESTYCGRSACNDFSIGIELEGTDDTPYEEAQYAALAEIIDALRAAYPTLRDADIVGHCDIAPGRKTDPGPAFDWTGLRGRLNEVGS